MICPTCGSEHDATHRQECFACHVKGIGFGFRGGVRAGRKNWNETANEWKLENFGTSSDKELAAKGIVPASDYSWTSEGRPR